MSKWITINFNGSRCKACNAEFIVGEQAKWYRSGVAYHKTTWVMEDNGDWRPGDCIIEAPRVSDDHPLGGSM